MGGVESIVVGGLGVVCIWSGEGFRGGGSRHI